MIILMERLCFCPKEKDMEGIVTKKATPYIGGKNIKCGLKRKLQNSLLRSMRIKNKDNEVRSLV